MRDDALLTTGAALDGDALLVLERARGTGVWDAAGRRYTDALSGYWCAPLGYGPPAPVRAAAAQLRRLSYAPLDWRAHRPALALAEALRARGPRGTARVFFCSGGSEGVDTALKLARLFAHRRGERRRTVLLARRGSYHGATLGATAVSGFPELGAGVGPLVGDTAFVDAPDDAGAVEAALARHEGRVAAFIAEPVQAAGRVRVPCAGYWPRVAAAVRRAGALLILDEVLTGVGRTGTFLAAERFGIEPDLLVLGKGLAGGVVPLGAVLVSGRVAECLRARPFDHGYTFQGHPAACAAALAVLEGVDAVLPAVARKGAVLRAALERACGRHGRVEGLGLLYSVGLELGGERRRRVRARTLESGLLCGVESDALQFAPALTMPERTLRAVAAAAGRALAETVL